MGDEAAATLDWRERARQRGRGRRSKDDLDSFGGTGRTQQERADLLWVLASLVSLRDRLDPLDDEDDWIGDVRDSRDADDNDDEEWKSDGECGEETRDPEETPWGTSLEQRICEHRRRAETRGIESTLTVLDWVRVLFAFKHRCVYCGSEYRLAIDHVIPIARGGTNTFDNVVPACRSCNSVKCAMPVEAFCARTGRDADAVRAQIETGWAIVRMWRSQ